MPKRNCWYPKGEMTLGTKRQALEKIGRNAEIRTRDPLHPMQVRYQTAPRSEARDYTQATCLMLKVLEGLLQGIQLGVHRVLAGGAFVSDR